MSALVQPEPQTDPEAEKKKDCLRECTKRVRRKNNDRPKAYKPQSKATKPGLPAPELPSGKIMTIRGLLYAFGLPMCLSDDPEHIDWYNDLRAKAAAANKSVAQYLDDTTWHEHFGQYFFPQPGDPRPHDPDELRRERVHELERLRKDVVRHEKYHAEMGLDSVRDPFYSGFKARIKKLESVLAAGPVAAANPDMPVFSRAVDDAEIPE